MLDNFCKSNNHTLSQVGSRYLHRPILDSGQRFDRRGGEYCGSFPSTDSKQTHPNNWPIFSDRESPVFRCFTMYMPTDVLTRFSDDKTISHNIVCLISADCTIIHLQIHISVIGFSSARVSVSCDLSSLVILFLYVYVFALPALYAAANTHILYTYIYTASCSRRSADDVIQSAAPYIHNRLYICIYI